MSILDLWLQQWAPTCSPIHIDVTSLTGQRQDEFSNQEELLFLLISCKDGLDKGQKWYGPNRSRRYYEEVARIHRRTTKKSFMTQIIMMVVCSVVDFPGPWSQSQSIASGPDSLSPEKEGEALQRLFGLP